jgi:hypothetical protein
LKTNLLDSVSTFVFLLESLPYIMIYTRIQNKIIQPSSVKAAVDGGVKAAGGMRLAACSWWLAAGRWQLVVAFLDHLD